MIIVNRHQTDPYFNLAAEEYLLKHFSEDIVMTWQNKPSVIVGKHQNIITEINSPFLQKKGIPCIRRITGGGTVYHDLGNVNYSLIRTIDNREKMIDFRKFLEPVISFLQLLGVPASYEGKNNLMAGNRKISGNSAHVFKNRVIHHGTLLFDSDMTVLSNAIRQQNFTVNDKAVQSVRKQVVNLSEFLPEMETKGFLLKFRSFIADYFAIEQEYELSDNDVAHINQLANTKYRTWEWNYGYSPKYTFRNEVSGHKVELQVKNGFIEKVVLNKGNELTPELLRGKKHHRADILPLLENLFDNQQSVDLFSLLLGI